MVNPRIMCRQNLLGEHAEIHRFSGTINRKKSLTPQGTYMSAHDNIGSERKEDLIFLKELVEAGEITAVIDRTYPWKQIVEAHRYVDKGHKKGNVVITI